MNTDAHPFEAKADDKKNFLVDLILKQAYNHPQFSQVRFLNSGMLCPNCSGEFCIIVKEEPGRRTLFCQYCGLLYPQADIAA